VTHKAKRRIYTGEKPFQCDVCDNKYASKYSLYRHQKIHTGEKNHVCNVCDRAFTRKDILNNHLKTHNDENETTKQIIESNDCVEQSINKEDFIPTKPTSSLQRINKKDVKVDLKKVCIRINKLKIKTQKSPHNLTKVDAKETPRAKVSVDNEDPYIKDREIETDQMQKEADEDVAQIKEIFDSNNEEVDQVAADACQQCSSEMQIQEEADEDVAHIEEILDGGEDNNIEEEDEVPADACQQCLSENRNISQFICPHFFKLN